MEDAVTLNARHFIQMWQHLRRALEEFAQIKLKSPFFKYPRLNLGTVRVSEYKVSTLSSGTKLGTGSLCAYNFVRSGQSTALFLVLSSCFKMASGRNEVTMYTVTYDLLKVIRQSHIGYSKCEHTTILCRYPGTGSRAPSEDSP